jgi:hypothetical protein
MAPNITISALKDNWLLRSSDSGKDMLARGLSRIPCHSLVL